MRRRLAIAFLVCVGCRAPSADVAPPTTAALPPPVSRAAEVVIDSGPPPFDPRSCGTITAAGRRFGPVQARLGDLRGLEGADAETVRRTLQRRLSLVHACYEAELPATPDARGVFELSLTIAPDGTVEQIRTVSRTLRAPTLERCVQDAIEASTFTAHEGTRAWRVVVPIVLEQGSD